eukprot:scpid60102/ scgid31035/ 
MGDFPSAHLMLLAMVVVQVVFAHSHSSSEVTLPGLYGLSFCEGSHSCMANEGCVQLRPMCRSSEQNCARSRRPSPKICVPIGTSVNVSEYNACSGSCPIGCERQCRQPIVTACSAGQECVVPSALGRCIVGKAPAISCDQSFVQGSLPDSSSNPRLEVQGPSCPTCTMLDPESACSNQYHFLIRGKVLRRSTDSYTIRVKSVLFNAHNITVPANNTVTMLRKRPLNSAQTVPTSCACPVMHEGAQYVIAGYARNGKLSLRNRRSATMVYSGVVQSRRYVDWLAQRMRHCHERTETDPSTLGEVEEWDQEGNAVGDGSHLWRSLVRMLDNSGGGGDAMPTIAQPEAITPVQPTISTVGRWERSAIDAPMVRYHARLKDIEESQVWQTAVDISPNHPRRDHRAIS